MTVRKPTNRSPNHTSKGAGEPVAVPTTIANAIKTVRPTNPSNGQIGGLACFPVRGFCALPICGLSDRSERITFHIPFRPVRLRQRQAPPAWFEYAFCRTSPICGKIQRSLFREQACLASVADDKRATVGQT